MSIHDHLISHILRTVNVVIVMGAIFIISSMVLNKYDVHMTKKLRMSAVDECARDSRYERTIIKEDAKVSYPVLDFYKSCLKDKGY